MFALYSGSKKIGFSKLLLCTWDYARLCKWEDPQDKRAGTQFLENTSARDTERERIRMKQSEGKAGRQGKTLGTLLKESNYVNSLLHTHSHIHTHTHP